MAHQSLRSPRTARVVCGPSLDHILERIGISLGASYRTGSEACFVPAPGVGELEDFAVRYLGEEILSKYQAAELPTALATTLDEFRRCESQCGYTNTRMDRWAFSPFADEITRARNWIRRVVGQCPTEEVLQACDFGPGATTRLRRRKSDKAFKFSGHPEATHQCAALVEGLRNEFPSWRGLLPSSDAPDGVAIVRGNRVTTVAKNRKKRRTIAIEPDLNMFLQKGLGRVLRRRLKSFGIDLNDQTWNQQLARLGSVTGQVSTIDLKSASDSIAKSVVEVLLPPTWLSALGMCRSEWGVLRNEETGQVDQILYRKWSSMGNGYTFELESLIFSACVYAVDPSALKTREASVYGDDIVIPTESAGRLLELLQFLGFTANEKKTHREGPFRESCGKHYLDGYDVTPFYVKSYDRSLLSLMKIHNQIWRLQDRWTWLEPSKVQALRDTCAWLRSYAPASWRLPSIIDGLGDGAFVGYFDEVLPQTKPVPSKHKTWELAYYMPSFVVLTDMHRDNLPDGAIPASLLRLSQHSNGSVFSLAEDNGGIPRSVPNGTGLKRGERLAVKSLRVLARDCK